MFKMILMSTFALVLSVQARAQDATIDSLDAQTATVSIQVKNNATDLAAARASVSSAAAAVAAAQKEYDQASSQYHAEAGYWPTWLGGGGGTATTQKAYADAKAKLADANSKLDAADNKFYKLNDDSIALAGAVASSQAQLDKKIKALAVALQGNGLVNDFSLLKAKAGSVNTTLDAMARNLDKAAIGAYMKDKVSKMLNSPMMCESVKSCPKASKVPSSEVEQYMFPNTKDSSRTEGAGGPGTK